VIENVGLELDRHVAADLRKDRESRCGTTTNPIFALADAATLPCKVRAYLCYRRIARRGIEHGERLGRYRWVAAMAGRARPINRIAVP
jgi:hypothetical protein